MKRKILSAIVILSLVFMGLMQTKVFAKPHPLGGVIEAFNNSNVIANYGMIFGKDFSASLSPLDSNVLTITMTSTEDPEDVSIVEYTFEGSILSNSNLVDGEILTALFVAEAIGQVHGYDDGAIIDNFNLFSDEIKDYTVEEEGFEILKNEDSYSVQMDIEKQVPLIPLSEYYMKPSDFDIIKDIIDDETSGNQSGKNKKFAYDLGVDEEENYICIGEVDEITESTYKSILSALEVMYGEKMVEYFEEIYPSLDYGSYILDGFDIDVDYDMDFEEHPMFSGTKVVFVTLDNEYINDEILRTEFIGETVDRGDKTITLDFTKDGSYKLGFFDSVSASDAGFLLKYVLEPVFIESGAELGENEDTVYYNIVNGKIVVGDEENSVFKIVIGDEYLEISAITPDAEKTTVIAQHEKTKVIEYQEGKDQSHYRYGEYNLTVNVIFGQEVAEPAGYELISVENNDNELSFKFNIDYAKFQADGKVYMDGNLVDPANYTSKEGSTIVTFNSEYTNSLLAGEHTLKVAVADGEVTTTFNIANGAETTNTTNNPDTGDNVMVYVTLFVISIVGITFIGYKFKK